MIKHLVLSGCHTQGSASVPQVWARWNKGATHLGSPYPGLSLSNRQLGRDKRLMSYSSRKKAPHLGAAGELSFSIPVSLAVAFWSGGSSSLSQKGVEREWSWVKYHITFPFLLSFHRFLAQMFFCLLFSLRTNSRGFIQLFLKIIFTSFTGVQISRALHSVMPEVDFFI